MNNNNNNNIDFEPSLLAVLLLAVDHPILNKNNQLMDKLFLLLSQSFQIQISTKRYFTNTFRYINRNNNDSEFNSTTITKWAKSQRI
jgi:hypothetical protein